MTTSRTAEHLLRGMSANYGNGHQWDHLDSEVCLKGANEIAALRSTVQAMEDELAAAGKWHALMQRAAHALGLMAGTDLLAELIPAIERLAAAKQGEASRPDLLEKLTYHAHERDDLTLDEVLTALVSGWKKVRGRDERAMLLQMLSLLATHPAPVQEGWKPIESAPKDGSWILLGYFLEGGGGGSPEVAHWHGQRRMWCSSSRLLNSEGYYSPTHWMPLPSTPQEGSEAP